MNYAKRQEGFSLLEAMLAVLILMMGVVAITQLTRSLTASVTPSERGGVHHPEIVDQLLRDLVENLRAINSTNASYTGANLIMSEATYSVRADRTAITPIANGFYKATYTVTVEYEAPGMARATVGTVMINKISGPATKGGL
ncbi:hypothetical protein D3C72_1855960 [compost metagenome]